MTAVSAYQHHRTYDATTVASAPARALTPGQNGLAGVRIEINALTRRFDTPAGPLDAIRDVELLVSPGEFCVIVGPSGCGKTTLLQIVAGLDHPTSGSVALHGAAGHPPTSAMVFQGRSVFPWLTVRQNISYGLKLRGVDRRSRGERADQLLQTVGLSRVARLYPHQISEGMRQRVAIARALAINPDVLLMDEPFGALDEQTRFLLQEELLRIWEQTRKTVLFVTHSIDEAMVLADRVVVMSAQPGTIRANLPVPFPRPRALTDVRSNSEFAPLFTEIWGILRDEVVRSRRLSPASVSS